jgi:uncharacterized protein with NAD-binding domain and iron-sulfur cluster
LRLLTGETGLAADFFLLALPPDEALAVLPERVTEEPFFARIRKIESSPIVNVHLWYDRPVWDRGFAAFLNTPLQWAFNKTKLWGEEGAGQYIDVSLSGARDFVDMPGGEIARLFEKEMEALLPRARGARLARVLVTKEREATFAARPGIATLRPPQETPIADLFLAGDWTATGWPATMESAVRSGLAAAAGVFRRVAGRGEARAAEVVA